jgi:AraC family transcriptional regulator, regulatory protein of adaptative response / methylated-DNA-[protein]-cysteine methyltransferase
MNTMDSVRQAPALDEDEAYAAMHRTRRFKHELQRRDDVTTALYEAGFHSTSRAYEDVSSKLGMTPRQLRGHS